MAHIQLTAVGGRPMSQNRLGRMGQILESVAEDAGAEMGCKNAAAAVDMVAAGQGGNAVKRRSKRKWCDLVEAVVGSYRGYQECKCTSW